MVEERGELLLLPLHCGLPHTVQRLGHACPDLVSGACFASPRSPWSPPLAPPPPPFLTSASLQLLADLNALVDPDARGDPMSPLRWTAKSLRRLARELRELCELDKNYYPKGVALSDAEMAAQNIQRADFHGRMELHNLAQQSIRGSRYFLAVPVACPSGLIHVRVVVRPDAQFQSSYSVFLCRLCPLLRGCAFHVHLQIHAS